jgi:hypothetical protein
VKRKTTDETLAESFLERVSVNVLFLSKEESRSSH